MPKVMMPCLDRLRGYVREYDSEVFSTDVQIIFCKICEVISVIMIHNNNCYVITILCFKRQHNITSDQPAVDIISRNIMF